MAPLLFFFLFLLCEAASESKVAQMVKPGQEVTLKCDTGNITIRAIEWTRSDLEAAEYVLFYRDGRSDQTHQHSSFTGRVELMDDQLKTGNVSLILKNVSREDVGTYECRVQTAGSGRNKRGLIKTDPISRVELQVTEDQKGHNNDKHTNDNNNGDANNGTSTPHHVGLAVAVVVLVSAVGLLVSRSKRQREKKPEPSAAAETGDNLL